MFVDQGVEPPADVGGDISAEGRVKPCDVSAAVFSLLLFVVTLAVTEELCSFTKTTVCQGLSYMGLASSNTASLLEMSVSRRLMEAGNLPRTPSRTLDGVWGVVGLAVDIHRPVVGLSVWIVALCVQIQCHIQKIRYLEVCLDSNPQP